MADVAVRVSDPALARQVFDLVAAARADAEPEIGARTGLLVTDEFPSRTALPTVVVTHQADAGTWRRAAEAGVEQVVVLPDGAPLLGRRLQRRQPQRTGTLLRIVGSRGGSGATTLCVGLAVALAEQVGTVLVDADAAASGLDLTLGLEDHEGLRWGDLHDVRGPVPPASVLGRLPSCGDIPVLSQGRPAVDLAGAWQAVTDSILTAVGAVVADVPRYAAGQLRGPAQSVDILVVPHDVVALANTRRLIEAGALRSDAIIALRRIRGPMPVGAVAQNLPHRHVIEIPDCAGVRAGTDFGDLADAVAHRAYASACRQLAAAAMGVVGGDG